MITPAQRLVIFSAVMSTILASATHEDDGCPTEHPKSEDCHGLCGAEWCMRKAAKEMGLAWSGAPDGGKVT